jgi:DNA polymerase III gamma/tau subunit
MNKKVKDTGTLDSKKIYTLTEEIAKQQFELLANDIVEFSKNQYNFRTILKYKILYQYNLIN